MALVVKETRLLELENSDEDLTDAQIDLLLDQTVSRLRAQDTQSSPSTQILPRFARQDADELPQPYITSKGHISKADNSRLVTLEERERANGTRLVEDPIALQRKKSEEKKATAGPEWFNLPKTDLTPQLKRDLQVLHMRDVLDPHRHYKKNRGKLEVPEYSAVGTIKEGPTEFYSGRLTKKERKTNLVEEVLSRDDTVSKYKTKYNAIQERKKSGKKGHYKALMRQKYGDKAKV